MKPKLYMLIGLPASGKSTYAKSLDGIIFSSDALRAEMWGNEATQGDNQVLFTELHKRIKDCLRSGQNAIYDATNIDYKKRMAFLKELTHIDCEKICIFIAVPYEECIKRNKERDRVVPEYVIERMYKNFTAPYWYEGWDDIRVVNEFENIYKVIDFIRITQHFNQENHHHSLSLGEHCFKAFQIANRNARFGVWFEVTDFDIATLIHDNGKVQCKDFHNKKGEETEEAHYYNHQYVGCYNSFFFNSIDDHLYVAQLIQWHMHPYVQWKDSEKAMERDKKLLGEDLFNDIMILHEADVKAH